jgi:hypothetical protein
VRCSLRGYQLGSIPLYLRLPNMSDSTCSAVMSATLLRPREQMTALGMNPYAVERLTRSRAVIQQGR